MAEAKTPRSQPFRVGYALLPKKEHSFIQRSLVTTAAHRGINFIKIDPNKPLLDQGPFDCVLHKLNTEQWRTQLNHYKLQNPNSIIIDSPDSIRRLHNRISMLEAVSEIEPISGDDDSPAPATFGTPKQTVIYTDVTYPTCLTGGLTFPVIAKPLVADGSAKSHKMSLIFNREGLYKLKPPAVLQEFVNHGGVMFKVFVVGEYVKCVKRKSLADINQEKFDSMGSLPSLAFCQVSNMNNMNGMNNMNESVENDESYYKVLEDAEMPPVSLVNGIARGLRRVMRLNLFNFDVIRDVRVGNRYLVVDINYFPGYAKMPGYEAVLTEFFWDVLTKEDARLFDKRIDNGDVEDEKD